jgi:hypothetical protein
MSMAEMQQAVKVLEVETLQVTHKVVLSVAVLAHKVLIFQAAKVLMAEREQMRIRHGPQQLHQV